MEVVERWAAHHPELEVLSLAFRDLHAGIRALGEPAPAPDGEQARASVAVEVAEFQELVATLAPEAERLSAVAPDAPLTSLAALHAQLQAEWLPGRSPGRARSPSGALGGEALCGSLRRVMDGASRAVPPEVNDALEAWVQEFLREPLERLHEHCRQDARLSEGAAAVEQSLVCQIRELSEQICRPGFRPDRVDLMDTRSVLVQQLLSSMSAGLQAAATGDEEQPFETHLKEQFRSFEDAHAASARAWSEAATRHSGIAETLDKNVESLAQYLAQRKQSTSSGAAQRREFRAAKMARIVVVMQDVFAGLLSSIAECRREAGQHAQAELEADIALEVGGDLKRQLCHFRDFHKAAAESLQEAVGLELRFAEWLREAHKALRGEVSRRTAASQEEATVNRARLFALSRAAVEQVQTQRAQLQEALEWTMKEHTCCQRNLSVLEFSKPTKDQVRKNVHVLEQVQESVRWQRREVEALTIVEQRIAADAAKEIASAPGATAAAAAGEAASAAGAGGEWLAQHAAEAEAWVAQFFFTRWQRDVPAPSQLSPPAPPPPAALAAGSHVAWSARTTTPEGATTEGFTTASLDSRNASPQRSDLRSEPPLAAGGQLQAGPAPRPAAGGLPSPAAGGACGAGAVAASRGTPGTDINASLRTTLDPAVFSATSSLGLSDTAPTVVAAAAAATTAGASAGPGGDAEACWAEAWHGASSFAERPTKLPGGSSTPRCSSSLGPAAGGAAAGGAAQPLQPSRPASPVRRFSSSPSAPSGAPGAPGGALARAAGEAAPTASPAAAAGAGAAGATVVRTACAFGFAGGPATVSVQAPLLLMGPLEMSASLRAPVSSGGLAGLEAELRCGPARLGGSAPGAAGQRPSAHGLQAAEASVGPALAPAPAAPAPARRGEEWLRPRQQYPVMSLCRQAAAAPSPVRAPSTPSSLRSPLAPPLAPPPPLPLSLGPPLASPCSLLAACGGACGGACDGLPAATAQRALGGPLLLPGRAPGPAPRAPAGAVVRTRSAGELRRRLC